MAFDMTKWQLNRTVTFNNVEYRVLEETTSGMLLVSKEEDVKSGKYPLPTFIIPEH
jgi:hypothetical protein